MMSSLIEAFESRLLLSGSHHGPSPKVTVTNGADAITVTGTIGSDRIGITRNETVTTVVDFVTGKITKVKGGFKPLVVNVGEGNDIVCVSQSGLAPQDAAGNLVSTIIRGGAGADGLFLTTDGGIITVLGEGGNDTIVVDTGAATYEPYLSGGGDADTITAFGTTGAQIRGDAGNDTLTGSAGNDTIDGGDGDDTLCGGDGNDTLNGNEGFDSLFGESGDDSLYLSNGNASTNQGDTLIGGTGNNVYFSQTPVNVANTLDGTDGYDRYFYSLTNGPGNNTLIEIEGSFAGFP